MRLLRRGLLALWVSLLVLAFPDPAPAEPRVWERPVFRLCETIRAGLRGAKDQIPNEWVTRGEVDFFEKKDRKWTVFPFVEGRFNLDDGDWSRVEAGAELGLQPFSWAYLGNAIHHATLDPGDDRSEWEVRALFIWPLPWWRVRSEKLSLYALNEWTFNINNGEGARNEMGAGIRIPLPWKHLSTAIGWRHVDLIHRPDLDQFEGSLRADF